jgi:putative transposase
VYNTTLEWLADNPEARLHWMALWKDVIAPMLPEWCDEVPFMVKKEACHEAHEHLIRNKVKAKQTGQPFSMSFRSRKNPVQSCFIKNEAIKQAGIYVRIAGNLRYTEPIPDDPGCSRLVCESDRWFITIPFETTVTRSENQARGVALDPGIRTFITFFSPDLAGYLGYHDFGRLVRLCHHLDHLISRMSRAGARQRQRMKKAAHRLRWKIKDLRNELHWKVIHFLCDEFDVILLPSFEVAEMVTKTRRKLRSQTVRTMLTYGHYQFEQRLKAKAAEMGKTVVIVNEAYTSKTCSWSGEIVNVGSSEYIRGSDGIRMHRDMNGARGIFLRAWVDTPWRS